ncbi:MAG TPA: zinc-dependent dehydrogenase [Rubrobacter sp.]|nr:zinc-dependent dehydrogenase [Rubrobacter sp.]
MKAAVFHGPGEMEVTEVDRPEVGPEEILIKVGANTVCGTDVRIVTGQKTSGVRRPSIIGHEFAGKIAQVGERVRGYEQGMPVAVAPTIPCHRCYYCQHGMENVCDDKRRLGYELDGGLGEYVLVPADGVSSGNVFVVGDDTPVEHLALAEPLACCVNGQRQTPVGLNDTVLIMGAGPIGLFHLQLALLSGAETVIVSQPSAPRREFAAGLGAHLTVNPGEENLSSVVAEATGGLGVDVAIVCIGKPGLVNDALGLVRRGGSVNIFAGLSGEGWAELEANRIHYDQLRVTGVSDCSRSDYEAALRLIRSGRVDVSKMVTHRFPLAEVNAALDSTAKGEGIKAAVVP